MERILVQVSLTLRRSVVAASVTATTTMSSGRPFDIYLNIMEHRDAHFSFFGVKSNFMAKYSFVSPLNSVRGTSST